MEPVWKIPEPAQECDQGHLQAQAKVGKEYPSSAKEKFASVNIILCADQQRIVSQVFKTAGKEVGEVDGRNNKNNWTLRSYSKTIINSVKYFIGNKTRRKSKVCASSGFAGPVLGPWIKPSLISY